jgi:rare lipoprotein A
MRVPFGMMAIALIPVWVCAPANSAAAQSFNDRWSIIPKAHAEPAPEEAPDHAKQDTRERSETQNTSERNGGGEPTVQPDVRSGRRSSKRVFSGKASYYSYSGGKTASGSAFNRHSLTAAHRNLPFGTKVRVTDLASSKSVVVRITDRGPWIRGRVLDLSLGAARNLGISEKGVTRVRAEVL